MNVVIRDAALPASGYGVAEAVGTLPRLKQLAYPIEEALFLDAAGRLQRSQQHDDARTKV